MTTLLVTSISALLLQSTLFTELAWPKLKATYTGLLRVLDAFAENRMRNAVPECEQHRAAREINRYRRMMGRDRKSPAKTVRVAR